MWGWRTVERVIEPSVSLSDAKQLLQQHGFRIHASHPAYVVFRSSGTESPWTTAAPDVRNVPLELAVAQSHSGLYLQLRYGTFVLFDTGDLGELADEIAGLLMLAANQTEQAATTDRPLE